MPDDILKKIIDNKKIKINNLKKKINIDSLAQKIDENKTFIAGDLSSVENPTFYAQEKGKS